MANDERATPQELFDRVNSVFHFGLDAAASKENHKCNLYYIKEYDGLSQPWGDGSAVWVNPPYSRGQITLWIAKATAENRKTVMILPCDSSTKWFHQLRDVARIFFIKGRISFGDDGPAKFGNVFGLWNVTQEELIALAQVVPGWWT